MIDAAIGVFSERGYAGASIEAIARESGMTIGALYSNFSGKRELFLAALRVSTGQGVEAGPQELDTDLVGDARDQLLADGTSFMRQVRAQPQRFRLLVWSMMDAANDPEVRSVVTEVLREQRQVQRDLLAECNVEGASGLTPEQGAVALNSMAIGFALQQMVDPELVNSAEGAEALRAFVAAIAEPAEVAPSGKASEAAASV
jgi:AcrR family transcriptional regulator